MHRVSGEICFRSPRFGLLLRDGDLFPIEGIRSNGMKLYASYPAAKVIGYALAALQACESPLTPVFESLLEAQFGKHFQAASHKIYDAGGIGAEISRKSNTLMPFRVARYRLPSGAI